MIYQTIYQATKVPAATHEPFMEYLLWINLPRKNYLSHGNQLIINLHG